MPYYCCYRMAKAKNFYKLVTFAILYRVFSCALASIVRVNLADFWN